jgi:hypothetical protein
LFASKPAGVVRHAHQTFMRHNDYRVELGHVTEAFCTIAATAEAKDAVGRFFARSKRS